jgi:hypothetical protein
MREIVFPPVQKPSLIAYNQDPLTHFCPECGKPLVQQVSPCPEGKPGCAVLHTAYQCQGCRKWFSVH